MRKLFSLLGTFLLFSCGPVATVQNADTTTAARGAIAVASVTPESIGEKLAYLASDELRGRDTGTEGVGLAADYVANFFREAGVRPFYPDYRDTLSNFEGYAANVVGYLEGSDPELKNEFVVIGAHYDHVGVVRAVDGDTIANGANDNASGTVAVMEIAGQMVAGSRPRRSILFALFTAEEKGLKGSEHLAGRLKAEGVRVVAVINFEMLGVSMDREYLMYMTGYEKSTMAEKMNEIAGETVVGLLPEAEKYNLFKRSDNYPFYKVFGVPAHTLSTFDFTNFKYYHQPGDEFQLMDLDHMSEVIQKVLPLVRGVVNSDKDVVRIHAAVSGE